MSAILETDDRSAACFVARPAVQLGPLVLASPHSGREYSAEFLAISRLDPRGLRKSEDSFVDELFGSAPTLGAPLLCASFPRAFCDVNRERWELDPDMFEGLLPSFCNTGSRRVAAGFGTIARVVSNGEAIYRRKLRFDEAARRVADCWEPYHAALQELIDSTRRSFGRCLVIDCHSMPGEHLTRSGEPARFVLGDAHGASCAGGVVAFVEDRLAQGGHSVRRNDPYAGGFVTRHYGRPREGVHVLQIEVARSLYMDERRQEKRRGFDALREDLDRLIGGLIAELRTRPGLLPSVA